jgi:aminoglycoside phosphotransferase
MIEEIKKIISGVGEGEIKVSKFFHGSPSFSSKVLFYATVGGEPACIIKMPRASKDNDMIEREVAGLKHFQSLGLRVPEILSTGQLEGRSFVCQRVVSGQPVGLRNEEKFFPAVAIYHKSVKKGKEIKIKDILQAVESLGVEGDEEFKQVVKLLQAREDKPVVTALQHGDLTYKNLIANSGEVTFIDFENFGLRSIWGNDAVHYLARLTKVYEVYHQNKNLSETVDRFVRLSKPYREKYDLEISDEECADLFLLDLLLEDLQKTYAPARPEVILFLKNLWLK